MLTGTAGLFSSRTVDARGAPLRCRRYKAAGKELYLFPSDLLVKWGAYAQNRLCSRLPTRPPCAPAACPPARGVSSVLERRASAARVPKQAPRGCATAALFATPHRSDFSLTVSQLLYTYCTDQVGRRALRHSANLRRRRRALPLRVPRGVDQAHERRPIRRARAKPLRQPWRRPARRGRCGS